MLAQTLILGLGLWALVCGTGCADGDDTPPGKITDLHYFTLADALDYHHRVLEVPAAGLPNTRVLAWTAPGDDGFEGMASLNNLRYITVKDLARWGMSDPAKAMVLHWEDTRRLAKEPYPLEGGWLEQMLLPRLHSGDTVWFALQVLDEVGNEAKISNLAGPLRISRLAIPVRVRAGVTGGGFGQVMAGAGDINHDQYPDVILGETSEGLAAIFLGRSNRKLMERAVNTQGLRVLRTIPELVPDLTVTGDPADEFGAAVAGLFKINADQFFDVGVGAPGFNPGGAADTGRVYIAYGKKRLPETLSADSVEVILTGAAAGDRFGASLAPAFDLNFDERNEFLVGAPGAFGRGAVYVFRSAGLVSGSAADAVVVIMGETAGDGFGAMVSTAGDVNGDGMADFAVGAPAATESGKAAAGAVYIFYGGNAGVIKFIGLGAGQTVVDLLHVKADVTIRGTVAGRQFGRRIVTGGNLAGDHGPASDLAIAGGNTVYAFFGGVGVSSFVPFPLLGASVEGLDTGASARLTGAPGEEFGAALAGPGDLDREGADDLVVGAPGADRCYVFAGPLTDGQAPLEIIQGPAALMRFGAALTAAGDLNLDGFLDLLIGAPLAGEAYFSF